MAIYSYINGDSTTGYKIFNLLLQDSDLGNKFYYASSFGQHEEVQQLLEQGCSPNFHTKRYSQTPLHTCYDEKVAKMLIEYGANLTAVNQGGDTPYEFISFFYCLNSYFNDGDRDDNIARQEAILDVLENAMDDQGIDYVPVQCSDLSAYSCE